MVSAWAGKNGTARLHTCWRAEVCGGFICAGRSRSQNTCFFRRPPSILGCSCASSTPRSLQGHTTAQATLLVHVSTGASCLFLLPGCCFGAYRSFSRPNQIFGLSCNIPHCMCNPTPFHAASSRHDDLSNIHFYRLRFNTGERTLILLCGCEVNTQVLS